jgi:hypothetical protein
LAGLGRIQQRFTTAILGSLAALIGFARGGKEEAKRLGTGHPLLAKYLKCNNPRANTPGHTYPGYGHYVKSNRGRNLLPFGVSTRPANLKEVA